MLVLPPAPSNSLEQMTHFSAASFSGFTWSRPRISQIKMRIYIFLMRHLDRREGKRWRSARLSYFGFLHMQLLSTTFTIVPSPLLCRISCCCRCVFIFRVITWVPALRHLWILSPNTDLGCTLLSKTVRTFHERVSKISNTGMTIIIILFNRLVG